MTTDLSLWTSASPDPDAAYQPGALVLHLASTEDQPIELYVWGGSPDEPYSTIADSAAELCQAEGRRGTLDLIVDDETSRRVATIQRDGGWRIGG